MPGGPSTPSRNSPGTNNKMTRAVVANLNRQKPGSPQGTTSTNGGITSLATPTPIKAKKTPLHKTLPPQPSPLWSKDLPDVPEFYIVRPAPSTSKSKIERNDRRVFINRNMMEKININEGSVVLIQRYNSTRVLNLHTLEDDLSSEYGTDEDDGDVEQATVGTACPMDRIEPNGLILATRLMDSG
jgi:hypothetical protein